MLRCQSLLLLYVMGITPTTIRSLEWTFCELVLHLVVSFAHLSLLFNRGTAANRWRPV